MVDVNVVVVKFRERNNMCRMFGIKYYREVQTNWKKIANHSDHTQKVLLFVFHVVVFVVDDDNDDDSGY